ncbi:ricin-type beta-trefoil lectin domain protein [Dactylosporangium sp. CA-139066]|uniref:ricin-type beta-trefoil lectin domain protein n=1 Tax=Dactylosporangium sp. CA-139066 TaxID=3239930 RepID=UPI003D8B5710
MTSADQTDLGPAGPNLDEEPLLVRPYVRLRQDTDQPTIEVKDVPPPSDGQPEHHDRPATTGRAGPPRSRRRIGSALTRHTSATHRSRRQLLTVGSGALVLLVGTTAVVLAVGGRPASPAAEADGPAAPNGGHLTTGAVQAPPSSAASNTASTAEASPLSLSESPSAAAAPAPASDTTQPSAPPALDQQPAPAQPPPAGSRTGRITGASGLCLDGSSGPHDDKVRRWKCDGSAGQTWTVASDGTLQNQGRCLQAAGSQVTVQTCDGGLAQQWRPGPAGSLVSSASGLCLGGPDDEEDADSRASQRMAACNQSTAQRWTLP